MPVARRPGNYRRLAAIKLTWRNLKAELRDLIPIGDVDGNTAIAGLSRVATWLDQDVASAEVPFE